MILSGARKEKIPPPDKTAPQTELAFLISWWLSEALQEKKAHAVISGGLKQITAFCLRKWRGSRRSLACAVGTCSVLAWCSYRAVTGKLRLACSAFFRLELKCPRTSGLVMNIFVLIFPWRIRKSFPNMIYLFSVTSPGENEAAVWSSLNKWGGEGRERPSIKMCSWLGVVLRMSPTHCERQATGAHGGLGIRGAGA